ncbi:MAG: ATP-binding protein [Myxococcota bacterium]
MSYRVLAEHEIPVVREEDIVRVRRKVHAIAKERGFDTFAAAAVTTATSELARNVYVHGGGGLARIEEIEGEGRFGLRIEFRDRGPGIANVERVLRGGVSTAGSLGLGLSGSRRLVDDFVIDTTVGEGTVVTITKWTRFPVTIGERNHTSDR